MIRKRFGDALLVLLLALGIFLWQRTVFPLWMSDLVLNQVGAYYFRTGDYEWMYTTASGLETWHAHSFPIAQRLGNDGDLLPFLYPPFVAALLSPFAQAPAIHWRNTLFVVNVLLVFLFAFLIVRLCQVGLSLRAFLWALALVLLCYPMARATKLGQLVPLLAALTWAGLLLMRSGKTWLSSILLGLVGAAKLFPLALIALPLFNRRFKMAVVWLTTAILVYVVSMLTIGLQLHLYWWEAIREFTSLVYPFFGNQSLLGWLGRVAFGLNPFQEIPMAIPAFGLLRMILIIIFGGISFAALWRIRGHLTGGQLAISGGLVLSTIRLLLPNAWEHYWLFVLPSLGWAIYETVRHRDARFWEILLSIASFFFLMKLTHFYFFDTLFSRIMSGSQTIGMLLLWVWLLRRAWRMERTLDALQTA
ncbi:MAG: glycosyltransferase family 87 protein [bacterium]